MSAPVGVPYEQYVNMSHEDFVALSQGKTMRQLADMPPRPPPVITQEQLQKFVVMLGLGTVAALTFYAAGLCALSSDNAFLSGLHITGWFFLSSAAVLGSTSAGCFIVMVDRTFKSFNKKGGE